MLHAFWHAHGTPQEPENFSKSSKKPSKTSTKGTTFGPPSYPWKLDSCWLDTALELLYTCLMRNYQEFSIILESLGEDSALRPILESMETRRQIIMDVSDAKISSQLGEQRDKSHVTFMNWKLFIALMDSTQFLYVI